MNKTSVVAGALAVVLGLGGAADACHRTSSTANRSRSDVHGTVTSVGKNSLNLSVGSGKTHKQLTVKFNQSTSVKGASRSGISASLVGSSVTVIGAKQGQTINASEIVIAG